MDNIFHIDPQNVIPLYMDLDISEKMFSDTYINKFHISSHEQIETPFIVLYPTTLQNLVIDIIRDYNIYLMESILIDSKPLDDEWIDYSDENPI